MTLSCKRWLQSYVEDGRTTLFAGGQYLPAKNNVSNKRNRKKYTLKASLTYVLFEPSIVITLMLLAKEI